MKRPIFFSSFFSIQRSGSKFLTSAAMRQSNPVASKWRDRADAALAGEQLLPDLLRADSAARRPVQHPLRQPGELNSGIAPC